MSIFKARDFIFPLNARTYIVGIVNVTPDSFSDGGEYFCPENAIAHIEKLVTDAADIIDIGAMSTRPGSQKISAQEEISRLTPLFNFLSDAGSFKKICVSIDTIYTETAEFALKNGVSIINDVSGEYNPDMAKLVKKYDAGWILTHNPKNTDYPEGVTAAVNRYFSNVLTYSRADGIEKSQICLDAGFGFGKNTEQNLELLRNTEILKRKNVAFMTALSRKRFLGEISGIEAPDGRDEVTAVADILAIGSDFLRVHNVAAAKKYTNFTDKILWTK